MANGIVSENIEDKQIKEQSLPCKLIIADSDHNLADSLARQLRKSVSQILVCDSTQGVLSKLADDTAVVVVNLHMPQMSGLDCLREIKSRAPATQVIIMSTRGGVPAVIAATRAGAFWYLEKPFDKDELLALVDRAYAYHSLLVDNKSLRQGSSVMPGSNIIGTSPVMQDLLSKIGRIAEIESAVLLMGETGTGKSTLARLIHALSPRSQQPFVMLNCSAVPRELIEAELFGHEKGAFTGAVSSRLGALEQANGGTLFLDEIGDLPLDLQPKLLTFLQERVVRRLGGGQEKKLDVRVITATNRNLEEMVSIGRFREDLFYRINVLSVTIPPLRSRKEDLPSLIDHVLSRIAEKRGVKSFSYDQNVLAMLQQHNWPGNVRELENVLERATAFAKHAVILTSDIDIRRPLEQKSANGSSALELDGLTLEEIEKRALMFALTKCDGNKSKVARVLGISPKSVYNKLLKYGFQVEN